LNWPWIRRCLRPAKVFIIAALIGVLLGLLLRFLSRPVLRLLEEALYYRITKPLEVIQAPLTSASTKEAVTAVYLFINNSIVSLVAAFGGPALIRLTMKPEEAFARESRLTRFLHRLIGEGNETYMELSVLLFLLPLAVVFVNGGVLGLFSVSHGFSWKELLVYLAYILPHGLLELPAVVFAATIGYSNALRLDRLLTKGDLEAFFAAAGGILRSRRTWLLFSMVMALLVTSAAIETYVTPVVGRNMLQREYFSMRALNQSVKEGQPAFLVVTAAFGSTVSFHLGSPEGPPLPVSLVGSDRYPFEVDGRVVPPSEVVVSPTITVPEDEGVILLEFTVRNVTGPATVHIVAEHGKLRSEANMTILG